MGVAVAVAVGPIGLDVGSTGGCRYFCLEEALKQVFATDFGVLIAAATVVATIVRVEATVEATMVGSAMLLPVIGLEFGATIAAMAFIKTVYWSSMVGVKVLAKA